MQHLRFTLIGSLLVLVVVALILSPLFEMSSVAMPTLPAGVSAYAPGPQGLSPSPSARALVVGLSQPPAGTAPLASTRLHFLDGGGPLRSQRIWLFCFEAADAVTLLSEQWIMTDDDGYATPRGTCEYVAALLPKVTQPSAKAGHGPAFWVFSASWPTGAGVELPDAACLEFLCGAGEDIVIRKQWPLIVYNVAASLEWVPEEGSSYAADLKEGLRRASAYLADLTDGYMVFGPVTIFTGGHNWEGSDLRFQAANDLRPSAFAGGIVSQTMTYEPPSPPAPNRGLQLIYRPAAVFLGRGWDRYGDTNSRWQDSDGYRTLVHEWAHYALFLYDEYQRRDGHVTVCAKPDLRLMPPEEADGYASAMSWHYTSGELWQLDDPNAPPTACLDTDQYRVYGEADWTTLGRWQDVQGVPSTALRQASKSSAQELTHTERNLLAHLFDLRDAGGAGSFLPYVSHAGTSPVLPEVHALHVRTEDKMTTLPSDMAQVYLLKGSAVDPERTIFQGTTRSDRSAAGPADAGSITLLSANDPDDLRLFVDQYAYHGVDGGIDGGRYIYPPAGEAADIHAANVVATLNKFGSSLNLRYGMSLVDDYALLTRVRVELKVPAAVTLANPQAQICSADAEIGCPAEWREPLVDTGSGIWIADFHPLPGMQEFPLYNVVRVTADNPGFDGLVRWFRDAGGVGPGHKPPGAPFAPGEQREGPATVDRLHVESPQPCNRVMIMPAADYAALTNVEVGTRIVGIPLDIDILVGETSDLQGVTFCKNLEEISRADKAMRLTLFYNDIDLKRLDIDESQLQISHYDDVLGWTALQSSIANNDAAGMNFVAATITSDGIFALTTGAPIK